MSSSTASPSGRVGRHLPPDELLVAVVDANTGEGPDDGWAINISGAGVASVSLYAPSYGSIDTVQITRTISTSQAAGTVSRGAHPAKPRTTR